MLALPIATGISGFVPSLLIMAFCWFAMTASALLLLEVSLWMPEGAHVITMTSTILGPIGKWASWFLYLFICYASVVAYSAGGGVQIARALAEYGGFDLSNQFGCLAFILLFTGVIFVGSWFVGRVNSILFIGMVAAYVALVGMGMDEIHYEYLTYKRWSSSFIAVPMLLTAFSFQTMVPSLTPYLKHNAKAIRIAIIAGTGLAFVIYAIWQWLILGIVPVAGPNGLSFALSQGELPATQFLKQHVQGVWIGSLAEFFAFFAIVTSFLGMTLGLFDFLADGLKVNKEKFLGKCVLALLIIVPTYLIATHFERVFMRAMDATGGIGDAILNGIIPIVMVWRGRYYLKYASQHQTPGGKVLLAGVMLLFVIALSIELLAIAGWIPSVHRGIEVLESSQISFSA